MSQLDKSKRITPAKQKSLGAAAVEFALLLIPLVMIVAGIVEFGRTFWYYDALVKSTRDSARFLSNERVSETVALDTSLKNQAIAMVVNAASLAQVPGFSPFDVVVSCDDPNCLAPTYVTVRINAYRVVVGEWMPFTMPFGATTWPIDLSPSTTMRYMR